jgi:hypothetical protein
MIRTLCFATIVSLSAPLAVAQTAPETTVPEPETGVETFMTPDFLNAILLEIDPSALVGPGGVQLVVDDVPVTVLHDPDADRMRVLVPIASVSSSTPAELLRLMQANFDTALDARYAVADGRIWSVFMHPMAELDAARLISGVAQTVSLAQTYGTTYASSQMLFGRGDSAQRLQELQEPGEDL